MLRISLLGGFLIEHEGRGLPPISSAAGRSLLAYLITYRGRRHTRDLLAGIFWPDRSESSARKRLSQALWQIHTALRATGADEALIEVTPSQVSFSADEGAYWLDVKEFERLVGADQSDDLELGASADVLERATGLYRGDFLAGFYDDWMLLERSRLSDLYLHALERLVSLHKARSDYRAALSWAGRVVLEDQVRESGHREVMRLNFLLGRGTEALQQYERCEAILREELSVEPSAQTRSLRDEIIQLRDKGDRPFVPSIDAPLIGDPRDIPLVGRSTERTALVRSIEDTLVGRGGVTLVEGESGIGKTRFLRELVEDAHWRGVNVLWSQGDVSTEMRPYRVIGDALRSGVTRLRARQLLEILDDSHLFGITRVAPELKHFFPAGDSWTLPPDEERIRIQESMERTFLALGELGAHILFIDDAHWADPESLDVLEALSRSAPNLGLLMVLAFRSDEARDRERVWETLRAIDENSHPNRVVVDGLSLRATSQLIDEASGAVVSPSVAEGIFYETAGNPLFILETLRTMHEASDQILAEGTPPESLRSSEVASGVTQVIQRRLSNLDARSRVVLNAAAILGSRFDANLLTRLSRLESSETLKGLSQLVQRGVIVEVGDGYEFSHQQMAIVAGELLKSPAKKRLHREAAAAMESEHPDRIEDLAYHYAQAGMVEQAMRLAWQAGTRAVTLASYETAARYLREAIEWASRDEPPRAEYFELLCDFESTLDVLGERDQQIECIEVMDSVASDHTQMMAEASWRRARVLAQLGRHADALCTAHQALALAEKTDDHEIVAAVERTIGSIHSLAGDPNESIPHLERAITLIAGRTLEEAEVRRALGDVLADLQRYDSASNHLRRALELYEETGDARGVVDTKGLLGILHMERGDVDRAEDLYQQALTLARKLHHKRAQAANLVNLANIHYLRGSISEALDEYVEAADKFTAIADRRSAALARSNSASVRHLILGDNKRAQQEAQSALEFFESESHDWGTAFCLEILAGLADNRGDRQRARQMLRRGLALTASSQHRWLEAHLLRHLSEIELAAGLIEDSSDSVARARNLCLEIGLSDVLPTVDGTASQVALAAGNVDEAILRARRATKSLTNTAERPYVVWYQRHLVEKAAGNEADAENALTEARRLLERTLRALPATLRDQAISGVPANRAIYDSYRRTWPETILVSLPRDDVPSGRKLAMKDMVDLQWTISDPSDYELPDRVARRRHMICRLISEAREVGASPRVTDLAAACGVSPLTLRRDLTALRRIGHPVATRGHQSSGQMP